jgi:preprotein translocase subunit YajC
LTGAGWETLAAQIPVVLVFAGAVILLMRDQAKSTKALMDTFIAFMELRDKSFQKSLEGITGRMDTHNDQSLAQDAFVRERLSEREKV